jgi:hypothetical protein
MFIVVPAAMSVSLVVLTLFIGVYFARCYMEMLSQSSSGLDRVRWPNDTFQDWMGTAWLLLLVFGAAGSVTAMLAAPLLLVADQTWQVAVILVVAALFLWGAVPVLLCSLQHPRILALLPQRPGALLRVFGMSAPLVLATAAGVVLIARQSATGALLFTLFAPLAILIHARAWGRLVWLVLNERPRRRKSRRRDVAPEPEPEIATAIRSAESSPATRPAGSDEAYTLEATDFEPEPGHLAEHYEIQRERERWQRMKAGEENVDPLGRAKSPRPWTALAASAIFGVLLQEGTAIVCVIMMAVLGLAFVLMAMIGTIFKTILI